MSPLSMSTRGVCFVVVFCSVFCWGVLSVLFSLFWVLVYFTPSAPFCIITARDPHTAN